jgi:hypothetical protein
MVSSPPQVTLTAEQDGLPINLAARFLCIFLPNIKYDFGKKCDGEEMTLISNGTILPHSYAIILIFSSFNALKTGSKQVSFHQK